MYSVGILSGYNLAMLVNRRLVTVFLVIKRKVQTNKTNRAITSYVNEFFCRCYVYKNRAYKNALDVLLIRRVFGQEQSLCILFQNFSSHCILILRKFSVRSNAIINFEIYESQEYIHLILWLWVSIVGGQVQLIL